MTRVWTLRDAHTGDGDEDVVGTLDDARKAADRYAREGYGRDDSDRTRWIDTQILRFDRDPDGEIEETVTTTINPQEPKCSDGQREHDWQAPHRLVGGLVESPGVRGHGGGVIITEACMRCGAQKRTDTWAQRPDTGEQGLTSVAYHVGTYDVGYGRDGEPC